ncbi:MAG: hypothetical protein FJ288_15805 [Planctomycetes bacterium]|nr:hypothetical protein [Planctomycetota bacterium]
MRRVAAWAGAAVLIGSCLAAADRAAAAEPSVPAAPKWNPGHYMLVWGGYTHRHFDCLAGSALQGAQVRYEWRDLEPRKGEYDFSKIESDLAYLEKLGKRLFMQLMDRRFHSSGRPLPDYLYDDPAYGGGAEPFQGKGGSVARVWDPAVRERMTALLRALGRRFDREPHFEGFAFEESAIAVDRQKARGFTPRAYLDGLKELMRAAKEAFPHTTVIEYANWMASPPGALKELAEHCRQVGAGWGGPDVVPDGAAGRAPRTRIPAYDLYPLYAGKMPLGTAVQTPSFGGKEGRFTLDELYAMGTQTLKLNYMFWIRVEGANYSHSFTRDILPFINARKGAINADRPENLRPRTPDRPPAPAAPVASNAPETRPGGGP